MTETVKESSKQRSKYFLAASLIALTAAIVGFLKTFFLPSLIGTFQAPMVIYVHGAFLFSWMAFLVLQAVLIRKKKIKYHMLLGFWSLALVAGVMISTMAVGVYVMKRDAALGEIATSTLLGGITTPLIFGCFVAAGIFYRKKPEIHKRLMLLATIAIMWPAFFRFRHYFPSVGNPELVFGVLLPNCMTLIAMVWEKVTINRIHPVYFTAGLALFIENFTENYFFDSPGWRVVAHWLADFFI